MKIRKVESFVILESEHFKYASGLSTFKGITVLFDKDFDQRIFLFLKKHLKDLQYMDTIAIYETKGMLFIYCNGEKLNPFKNIIEVDIDSWIVNIVDVYSGEGISNE